MLRCEIKFDELLQLTPPQLQIYALQADGKVIAASTIGQSFGSLLSGSVTWRQTSVEFIHHLMGSDGLFFPIIIHRPENAGLVEFALTNNVGQHIYMSDPVDLSTGKGVDWFVVCLALWQNGHLKFKNVCSFPNASGDVVPQLQDLVSWVSSDEDSQTDWIDTHTVMAPKILSTVCKNCTKKDEEMRALKLEIEKQTILIKKLREERKNGFVSDLVGPDTLIGALDDELLDAKEDTQVDKLLQTQEELIGSIKQHIVKLSNQIKNGQRMRAISS